MAKDLAYYLSLDYPVTISYDPEHGYYANVELLGVCSAVGATAAEAYENVMESKRLWFESALEDGLPIPEPEPEKEYSGRLVLRLPKSLHARLARASEDDVTSLNQYLVTLLSGEYERNNAQKALEDLHKKGISTKTVSHVRPGVTLKSYDFENEHVSIPRFQRERTYRIYPYVEDKRLSKLTAIKSIALRN